MVWTGNAAIHLVKRGNAASKNSHRNQLLIGVSLAILIIVMSLFAHFEDRFPGDLEITILFQSIPSRFLLGAMESISFATGEWRAAVLVIMAGFVVWRCLGRLEGGLIFLAGSMTIINNGLKILINRPRPTPDLVTIYLTQTGKSFPSSHALFAISFLGILTYLAITHMSNPGLRILTLSVYLIAVLSVGASRIYLGVHWMSDVAGGYITGGWFLLVLIWLYRMFKPHLRV